MPSIEEVYENRALLFPANKFTNPISLTQFAELSRIIRLALNLGATAPQDWKQGFDAGILLALTVLERSSELHP